MSTIVTRAGKGSALTHNEVDANFTNLNTDKVEKSGTDPVVISVDSSSDALRITQVGAGNALVVEDEANPDSSPFVVNADGRVIVGTTQSAAAYGATTPYLQVRGTDISTSAGSIESNSTTASRGGTLFLARSRSTTIGGVTAVQSGDRLAAIAASGADGTGFIQAALITAEVDGTPGTDDMPGRLVFSTTADGASSPTERMRITSEGLVGIGRTPEATYQLDIANPSTASGADTFVRVSSSASEGDADAEVIVDAGGTGEATFRLRENGINRGVFFAQGGEDYIEIGNAISGADLYLLGAGTSVNDTFSLRYARDTGSAPVTGVTGTITSSANTSTITGLSTTTGLTVGDVLTKTAGTGVLGTQACIVSIDSATQITVRNGFAAMTAGSITFTATPSPTTITAYSTTAASNWAVNQDFARFAFGNQDGTGAGDGGIKASINAYMYDAGGTGAGLDFYVSDDGTALTKALRMTQTGTLTSQPTYDNTASGSTVVVTSAGLIRRTSSSLKYKKDVETLDYSLASNAVENLRPVWYRTKTASGDDKETWSHIGLIAEEVHEIEPRLVRYRTVEVTTDELGKRVETPLEVPEPEDVDYGRLAVLLLAEVKTMKNEISNLKAEITALKGV
jgi:hypothetical protein